MCLRGLGAPRRGRGAIVGIAFCLLASHAWARNLDRGARATSHRRLAPGRPEFLKAPSAPPAERGPVTLRPSISVSEEYNDNVSLNNQTRQWDLITGFSPAITLFVTRPSYELRGGYSFTAELYERESHLNNAFDRQNFVATGLYRAARASR